MIYLQNGFGATGSATTTASRVEIQEPAFGDSTAVAAKARAVEITNQGSDNLLLLINVPSDDLATFFTNRSPIVIPANTTFQVVQQDTDQVSIQSVGLKASTGTIAYVVNAY